MSCWPKCCGDPHPSRKYRREQTAQDFRSHEAVLRLWTDQKTLARQSLCETINIGRFLLRADLQPDSEDGSVH
jgi:hypothetical protein